jgi:hypothetical protein
LKVVYSQPASSCTSTTSISSFEGFFLKNRFPVTGWRRRLAIFANRPAGYGCRFCPKTGNRNRLFSPTLFPILEAFAGNLGDRSDNSHGFTGALEFEIQTDFFGFFGFHSGHKRILFKYPTL